MAISPTTTAFGTNETQENVAVQLVDVSSVGPNGQTSAKAFVTVNAGSLNASGVFVPGAGGGASSSARLPVGIDRSGTITAGGTAQDIAGANVSRASLSIQNTSFVVGGIIRVREDGGVASATRGFGMYPGDPPMRVSTNMRVSVWGATTAQAWEATETEAAA